VTGERLEAAAEPTADFDGDGTVDGDDLSWWQSAFGPKSLTVFPGADADGDSDADGADFLVWQRQLGSAAATASTAAIPEPASFTLAFMGILAISPLRAIMS
jgi:hypothetical protein